MPARDLPCRNSPRSSEIPLQILKFLASIALRVRPPREEGSRHPLARPIRGNRRVSRCDCPAVGFPVRHYYECPWTKFVPYAIKVEGEDSVHDMKLFVRFGMVVQQARKSLRLCLAGLRIRWIDPIAEVSELPDHSRRALLL